MPIPAPMRNIRLGTPADVGWDADTDRRAPPGRFLAASARAHQEHKRRCLPQQSCVVKEMAGPCGIRQRPELADLSAAIRAVESIPRRTESAIGAPASAQGPLSRSQCVAVAHPGWS
jgi:hypothetical protein